jgi:hypothetical protein
MRLVERLFGGGVARAARATGQAGAPAGPGAQTSPAAADPAGPGGRTSPAPADPAGRGARTSPEAADPAGQTIASEEGRYISFFNRRLPSWVEVRIFAIAPSDERPYRASEWRSALVVVERGQVDLMGVDGTRLSFARGDTLFLAGLPIRALRNEGEQVALLSALSRAADSAPSRGRAR